MYCEIIVTRPFNHAFTYKLKKKKNIKVGTIVSVPFGKQNNQIGMVIKISNSSTLDQKYSLKEIDNIFEKIILNKKIIKFIYWISDYTLCPIGLVLKLFLINYKIISQKKIEKKESFLKFNSVK